MLTISTRILFLEDLPADAEMAMRELRQAGIEFVGKVVETEKDFKTALNEFNPDIIVSDYSLPTFDGMSALKIVREHTHYIPFIVLTGSMNEETAVNCMKAGANDYVIKEQIKRLPYAVLEVIEANKVRLEKLEMEEQLLQSEEKFRNLFQNHSAIKLIIDPESLEIVDANHAAEAFYGWSVDTLTKMKISDINSLPEPKIREKINLVFKNVTINFDFRHRRANDTLSDVEVFSSIVTIGKRDYIHSIIHDITEKKDTEKKLKLLSRALEQNPVAIVISDYQGIIEYVNPAFTAITGYTLDEIKLKAPRILSSEHQSDRFYKQIWKNIQSGKDWQGEILEKKKNGELYWENVIISPIVDEASEITHFIMVREDITEKKRMMEELIEAKEKAEESDQLKTAFLTNMSHEVRTPMNGILGFTKLLSKPQLSGEEKAQYIEIIRKSGQRMLNTVNDIIEVSKIETGQVHPSLSPVNICSEIEDLMNFFKREAEQKGLAFHFDRRVDPGIILTDFTKFTSIVSNLLKNAIKYTDSGSVTVGCKKGRGRTIFFVKDTGIGIPADRQKAIFNRFEQADINDARALQGSGLGLSITKSYVEMLGGEVWLESEENKGSQFYFTIPHQTGIITKKEDHNHEITQMNKTKNSKLKILIAEDEEAATMFLSIILQERAAEFLYATTGTEAVELCKTNPDIDVVLMDIKMPEMDGYVATQRIRKFNKDVVIIAQTAYAITGDREKALEAGCNGYIAKPIDEDEMLELIDELV
jgi:PAS domain S-box-containing protein